MQIVWQKEAIDNRAEVELFIAQDSPTRARGFRNYLKEKSVIIAQNPYIGHIVPEFADPEIRGLLVRNYRIVYRISTERIEILTLIEGHQLLKVDEPE